MSHFLDEKSAYQFTEALRADGAGAVPVTVDVSDDHRRVDVTVALQDLYDWHLRERVLALAGQIGAEYDTTILCFFRSVDEVPELVNH